MGTHRVKQIRAKYRFMPDQYYGNDEDAIVTPDIMAASSDACLRCPERHPTIAHRGVPAARLWELCSGAGVLSSTAREKKASHCPQWIIAMAGTWLE